MTDITDSDVEYMDVCDIRDTANDGTKYVKTVYYVPDSVRVPKAVFAVYGGCSIAARKIWDYVMDCCTKSNNVVTVDRKELQQLFNISEHTVCRALKELVDKGLLERKSTNEYRLPIRVCSIGNVDGAIKEYKARKEQEEADALDNLATKQYSKVWGGGLLEQVSSAELKKQAESRLEWAKSKHKRKKTNE